MTPMDVLLVSLATFYTAYAIARTGGPLDVFKRLRAAPVVGPVARCFYCSAAWAALALLALQQTPLAPISWALAAAGAASVLYRYTGADAV